MFDFICGSTRDTSARKHTRIIIHSQSERRQVGRLKASIYYGQNVVFAQSQSSAAASGLTLIETDPHEEPHNSHVSTVKSTSASAAAKLSYAATAPLVPIVIASSARLVVV